MPYDFDHNHVLKTCKHVLDEVETMEKKIGPVTASLSVATTLKRSEKNYARVQLAFAKAYASRAIRRERILSKDVQEACQAFGCLGNAKSWMIE